MIGPRARHATWLQRCKVLMSSPRQEFQSSLRRLRRNAPAIVLVVCIVTGLMAGIQLHWSWPFMVLLFGTTLGGGIILAICAVWKSLPVWALTVGLSIVMFSLYGFLAWGIR